MGRPQEYTETEINDFLELAQQIGIGPAIKECGYPSSRGTANYWIKKRGLEVPMDLLKAKAAEMKHWYSEQEQMVVLQEQLTLLYGKQQEPDLTVKEILDLSRSIETVSKQMQLLRGEATSRNESTSLTEESTEAMKLMRARNEALRAAVEARAIETKTSALDMPSITEIAGEREALLIKREESKERHPSNYGE